MKTIQNTFFFLLFIALVFPSIGNAQGDNLAYELSYEVNKVLPYIVISKEELKEAQTLMDLDPRYKSEWVKEYVAVEISASHQGKAKTILGETQNLSSAQKDLMNQADIGTEIFVKVDYIPNNNLTHNEVKETSFSFTIAPDKDATFAAGQEQLKQYLKENVIDKIAVEKIGQYQMTAVKFSIDEEGHILDPHLLWSSEDEKIDEALLSSVCNMPQWKPATYANGLQVKQDFVLSVGDMESCVVNMLNIRKLEVE